MKEKASKNQRTKRSLFVLLLVIFSTVQVFAQTEIKGTVVDNEGMPAAGASIKAKGSALSLATVRPDGTFTIKDLPEGTKMLEINYPMQDITQEVEVTGATIDVKLEPKKMEVLVVDGYGVKKKKDLVTSIASIDATQLKDVPVSSATEAMQGKLTGVSVTTTEGSPDANVKVRVRGGGSITQSNDPLYIVDGFEVSSINDISPSEIKSIDVLKDAAATAIYGAKGANGVIIITTKEADDNKKSGKFNFNVDYSGFVGFKKITKYMDVLNPRDYTLMQYENQYLKNKNVTSTFSSYFDRQYVKSNVQTDITALLNDSLGTWFPNTSDWQKEVFGRTGYNSNHSVTFTGGNKKNSFILSYNRIDDKAIMTGSNYQRDNVSFKAKIKPIKNLTASVAARYSYTEVVGAGSNTSEDAGSSTQSRMRNAIQYTPIKLFKVDNSGDEEEKFGSLYDPLTTIDDNYKVKDDGRFKINGSLAYKLSKNWNLKSELGYSNTRTKTDRFYGRTTYFAQNNGVVNSSDINPSSSAQYTDEKKNSIINTNTVDYNKSFKGGHNFSLLLGEETVVNKDELYTYNGFGYDATLSGETVFNNLRKSSEAIEYNYVAPADNTLSFFGRANYDFRGRYYFTATMRADGSSRFSQDNRWGYFPSLAIAWRTSDEKFMRIVKKATTLSNMKFRFSYGTAGNNNVELGYIYRELRYPQGDDKPLTAYLDRASFLTSSYIYAGGPDKIAANPNLKWETTITRDLGLDYGFFKDRISGTVDVYLNNTRDLIVKIPISGSGYNYQYQNVGSTENKGFEFSVTGVVLDKKTKNLNYNVTLSANVSANRNKVVNLGAADTIPATTSCFSTDDATPNEFLVVEGKPLGQIFGFVSDGWYKASDFKQYIYTSAKDTWTLNTGVVTPYTAAGFSAYPGHIKLKDLNGDGQITDADKKVIGNTLPLFTGGFNLTTSIGSTKIGTFDVSANFTYSYGNDVLNLNKMDYTTILSTTDNTSYRNTVSDVAYGKRYSLFNSDGVYLPSALAAKYGTGGLVTGTAYTQMAAELDAANSSAKIWSPYMAKYILTDYCVEDGSFLRFAALTIGYSLPDRIINKVHLSKARVFFTAQNLFVLSNYSGFDPEVDTRSSRNPLTPGVDFSAYPKSRAFNVGLNLSF